MYIKKQPDKNFTPSLLRLALPMAMQSLMLASVAAADAIMLVSIDQDSMSAVSLASKVQFLQNMILSSIISAVVVLGAQYWGKKDRKSIENIFFIGLRLCSVTSIVFFAICCFLPDIVMKLLTSDPGLQGLGTEYLKIAAWSYLLTGISQSFQSLLKVSDRVKTTAIISSVTVAANIVLNAVFIYGLCGVPAMGHKGAAIATLIARVGEVLWSVIISYTRGGFRPNIAGLFHYNKLLSLDFAKCVLPLAGAGLLWSVGITAYASFMGHLDGDATAAYSICSTVCELCCCACNGLASGGGILVGNELGAGNLDRGKQYGCRIAKIGIVCGLLTSLLVLVITPFLMKFATLTEAARKDLLSLMLVLAVYIFGRAYNTIIINGIFYSGGDAVFDPVSLAVTMWCIAIPLAALGTYVFGWPPALVYACTCLDEVGKIPIVIIHFKKYKWVKDLTR